MSTKKRDVGNASANWKRVRNARNRSSTSTPKGNSALRKNRQVIRSPSMKQPVNRASTI